MICLRKVGLQGGSVQTVTRAFGDPQHSVLLPSRIQEVCVNVYETDPLVDPRWPELILRHTNASAFHTRGWLRSLRDTYGYKPTLISTSRPDGELHDGVVLCRVRGLFTGTQQLVSLPFSDHCEPLESDNGNLTTLLTLVVRNSSSRAECIEIRPLTWEPEMQVSTGLCPSKRYYLHIIDLQPDLPIIFRRLHKDCIQRKIRRAEREGITYSEGNSEALLQDFFRVFVGTRRRHGVPPQPWHWFVNLCACMGDTLKIRMAYKECCPIAGIITLSHRTTMVYKYGCSDRKAASLGATPMLFWQAIQDAKRQGMLAFDLGRSDLDAPGLIAFKERLGAIRRVLTYATYPRRAPWPTWPLRVSKSVFRHLPDCLVAGAGRILYPYCA